MSRDFGDVNARARGLQGHLLSRARLLELCQLRDPDALGAELIRDRYLPRPEQAGTPAELDAMVGHVAADRLNLLARWLGARTRFLRGYLERRDLAALRAILRGAASGAAPASRLRGVSPTPQLPERLLTVLARTGSISEVGRALQRSRHPAAALFRTGLSGAHRMDLLELELALRQWWAGRVSAGVRRAGRAVRQAAGRVIDEENLLALLVSPAWGVEVDPHRVFLGGGRRLGRERFLELARMPDDASRRMEVARFFAGTAAGRILSDAGTPVLGIARLLRAAAIQAARRAGRLDPLGPAPTIEVILRIEAEAEDLRRVVHGLGLGVPSSITGADLLAAA